MFLKLLCYRETYRTLLIPLEGNKAKDTKNKSLIRSQKKQTLFQCRCRENTLGLADLNKSTNGLGNTVFLPNR